MTTVQLVPIQEIRVINPRSRSKIRFREIVESIAKVGLKKPITVSCRGGEVATIWSAGKVDSRPIRPAAPKKSRPSSWMSPWRTAYFGAWSRI